MQSEPAPFSELIDADELDLLTDLLIAWCEKKGRGPEALLPHCRLILQRYRSGLDAVDELFAGL
jgi:hypothetical protein